MAQEVVSIEMELTGSSPLARIPLLLSVRCWAVCPETTEYIFTGSQGDSGGCQPKGGIYDCLFHVLYLLEFNVYTKVHSLHNWVTVGTFTFRIAKTIQFIPRDEIVCIYIDAAFVHGYFSDPSGRKRVA